MGDKFNRSFSINGQNSVIMRIDDTSSSMTWREHQYLGWKEASTCDFSNMSFRGVSFAGANFDGAKLDGSNFAGSDIGNAILTNVSAKNCNFEEADFAGSKLNCAEFRGSNFKKARFCTTNRAFESAVIDQADFGRCDLSDAVFNEPLQFRRQPSGFTLLIDSLQQKITGLFATTPSDCQLIRMTIK